MKRISILVLVFLFILAFNIIPKANAGINDTAGGVILQDSMYGAVIGGIAGCAMAGLSDDFSEHAGEYSTKGIAAGALLGIVFGFYEVKDAVFSYDDNKGFEFGMPQIASLDYNDLNRGNGLKVNLIQIKF